MATTLTTSYKDIASSDLSFTYGGNNIKFKVTVQAKYVNQSGSTAQIRTRAVVKNNSSITWTGTNKGVTLTIGSSTSSEQTWSGSIAAGATWTSSEKTSGNISGGTTTTVKAKLRVINNTTTASGSAYMPTFSTQPSTPTCVPSASSDSVINITWGTTDLGNPAGTVSLYEGTTNDPTVLMYSKSTTGTSVFGRDQRTANTTYYYKATATNSVGTVSSAVASATTYPAGVTSISTTTGSYTATHQVTCAPSGNALTTTLQKSHNNSNWVDVATDVQGTTVTVTETGLSADHLYTIYFRVVTAAGASGSSSESYRTQPPVKTYGSVNGDTKQIKKLYGSVNGQTKEVKKLYGSVNGVTKLIYQG